MSRFTAHPAFAGAVSAACLVLTLGSLAACGSDEALVGTASS